MSINHNKAENIYSPYKNKNIPFRPYGIMNKLFSFETEIMDISLSDLTYIPYPNAF